MLSSGPNYPHSFFFCNCYILKKIEKIKGKGAEKRKSIFLVGYAMSHMLRSLKEKAVYFKLMGGNTPSFLGGGVLAPQSYLWPHPNLYNSFLR